MKLLKITGIIFLLLLTGAYLGAWVYSARWFEREIGALTQKAKDEGVELLGPAPRLANFPFVPEIHYTTGIRTGSIDILFPALVLRGYPFPWASLTAFFPEGVALGGKMNPDIWALDTLGVTFAIPFNMPRHLREEELRAWQAGGGAIDVRHFALNKGALQAHGKGLLTLDQALQPVFRLDSKMTGYEEFIEAQLRAGSIEPLPAAIARGVFGSLARPDPMTGLNTVEVTASVENRLLRVGPVLLLELPIVRWDRHTPPGRPL
jgi:hypothetical protein